MGLKDARTIEPKALEDRRKQAVMLYNKIGMRRIEIAAIVGVHRNTVGEWIQAWKDGGARALRARAAGRPVGSGRRLEGWQAIAIKRLITDKTPDQLKFPFALWTRDAVRELIRQKYGIKLPVRTMGEYLKRWGFTPQKPVKRAYERNQRAVKAWIQVEYPEIAAQARAEKAEIQWGDETGMRSDDVNGRGYAPAGKTPVRRTKGTPEKINMISSITNRGKVRFMFFRERMSADVLIRFLKRLTRDMDRKIYLILDNLRVHHSAKVRSWVEQHEDQIALFFLPSYSPDLNPDEYLNNDLKSGISKRPDARHKGRLEQVARSHMYSIQKRPKTVQNYFRSSHIKYAA